MTFFDNVINTGKNIASKAGISARNAMDISANLASQVNSAIENASNQTEIHARNALEISSIKTEIKTIEEDLNHSYVIIGRKYVEYLVALNENPKIPIDDIMRIIIPKLEHKKRLEDKLAEIELLDKNQRIMLEKSALEQNFLEQKSKLDKSLSMEVITHEEYIDKINKHQALIDNFEEVRRIRIQYEMGIINESEMSFKLHSLGVE